MTHGTTLADVMNRSRYLLFDFDGPICSIFAGLPALTVADHLRELVIDRGIELSRRSRKVTRPVRRLAVRCDHQPRTRPRGQ
jgi:hypothetical protein